MKYTLYISLRLLGWLAFSAGVVFLILHIGVPLLIIGALPVTRGRML